MSDSYDRDSYRKSVNDFRDDAKWTMRKTFWLIVLMLMFFTALGIVGRVVGWFGRTAEVVSQQVDPGVMLKRYEWFKDASAALDAKGASIEIYEKRFKDLEAQYTGIPRRDWAREDREQWNLWQSEVAGIKSSFNILAADYNSQMSKWNYAFTNVGDLPKGATKVLPKEYKPYVTS